MLNFLIQLPSEVIGQNILVFLGLIDIIQLENAAASHKSQKLLKDIFPYCPPIEVTNSYGDCFEFDRLSFNWFHKRRFHVQFVCMAAEFLHEVEFEHFVLDNIELYLSTDKTLNEIQPLENRYIYQKVSSLGIEGNQDATVMKVLFSQLCNVSKLELNNIESSNIFQWIEYIKILDYACTNCLFMVIQQILKYIKQ